jgi:cell division protein FtsI/penicillin-binding protein 2
VTHRRTRLPAVAALLVAAAVAAFAAWQLLGGDDRRGAAHDLVAAYLKDWSRGADRAASARTDRPAAAAAALRASRSGLDGATVRATMRGDVRLTDDRERAVARVRVIWQVPRIGRFAYTTSVPARLRGERWQVRWRPQAVHPRLTGATRLGTAVSVPARGRILARDGEAIVKPRRVYDVAVETDRVRDPDAFVAQLAELPELQVDAKRLAAAVRDAPRGRFVPVVTLRPAAFERIADRLRAVRGVSINPTTLPLAPTPTYARALIGTVGPATAEQLEKDPSRSAGASIGQSGLQAAHDKALAGSPSRSIVIRDRQDGSVAGTLLRRPGRRARGLRTTLDLDVQAAAEAALGDMKAPAALVAVKPSTGDVLGVANRPATSTYDRALTGLYPPGSTFKVVSTTALLRAGLQTDEPVACPPTLAVDGKAFRNFEGGASGSVPFSRDFAVSCNTAFISLAGRIGDDALPRVARDFGLGRRARPGAPVADSRVPAPRDRVSEAAMMIGQDRIVTSPLAMAGVAATVAAGRWHAPRILASDPRAAGPALPERDTLRTLMRGVVTSGSGEALAGIPGEVIGKSGTAEYGGGDPPPTHAWFIAARDDLAIAVLVEDGRSGGSVAAPIAARFFTALDAGGG